MCADLPYTGLKLFDSRSNESSDWCFRIFGDAPHLGNCLLKNVVSGGHFAPSFVIMIF